MRFILERHRNVWKKSGEQGGKSQRRIIHRSMKIVSGMEGLIEVSTLPEVELLVTAIVGMIGIRSEPQIDIDAPVLLDFLRRLLNRAEIADGSGHSTGELCQEFLPPGLRIRTGCHSDEPGSLPECR